MKKFIIMFVMVVAILVFAPRSLAAPGGNPIFATIDYVQNLFQQNQTDLDFLRQRVIELEDRVEELEQDTVPEITEGTFVFDEVYDLGEYSRLIVEIASSNHGSSAIFSSDDQVEWKLQSKFGEDFGNKPLYLFSVRARYYKVTTWGDTSRQYNFTVDNEIVNGPTARFTLSPEDPHVGQEITFTDTSTGSSQRKWEFGSPYTSYQYDAVEHLTPNQAGSFIVHIFVQNVDGIIDTYSKLVNVTN